MSGLVLIVLLLIFLIVYFVLRTKVNQVPEGTICENIYIDDVDVSGMKAEEAKAALAATEETYRASTLELKVEEASAEVTLGELGFRLKEIDKLVADAVTYGKKGSLWSRYKKQKDLKKEKKEFYATYEIDAAAVEALVSEKIPHLENEAKDATIKRENGRFVITDEVKGIAIDTAESAKVIETYLNQEWQKDGGRIELVSKVGEPKVTRADLETIQDVLGTFTTNCGTGGGRVQNIKTGAAHINGKVLMPGEEYSANAAMEPYTAENGYTEAGSYENGKVVQSMGGGICQVSSTLYNAVILAELEIVERAAHSMLVSYVKPSMDAAIAGDFKDLKFKNNQNTPVYIEGYVSGGYITFNVFGKETRAADRKIEFVSEVVSSTPAGEKFVATQDAVGTLKKASSGYEGMKAKLWKVVYENGAEVSRKVVNNSTYNASAAVYNVGTASAYPEVTAAINSAIANQSRAEIEAAIAKEKELAAGAQGATQTPEGSTEGQ